MLVLATRFSCKDYEEQYSQITDKLEGFKMLSLIEQFNKEIPATYEQAKTHTFNSDFVQMMLVCVLVPFIHEKTFQPSNVVNTTVAKEVEREVIALAMHVFVKKHKFEQA